MIGYEQLQKQIFKIADRLSSLDADTGVEKDRGIYLDMAVEEFLYSFAQHMANYKRKDQDVKKDGQ